MRRTLRASIWKCLLLVSVLSGCDSTINGNMPGTTPQTHDKFFPITTGPHAVACATCHTDATSFKTFQCFNCHGHEQPPTDLLHTSTNNYSYASTACYTCHPRGEKQTFDHANITGNCATCHDMGQPFAALPVPNFTHPSMNGQDCGSCHFSTSNWASNSAPTYLTSDPLMDIQVNAQIPTYAATTITNFLTQTETLKMQMNHQTANVDPAAFSACTNCHASASQGSYYPGSFHYSLTALMIAQPTACTDCHGATQPTGFVGPVATSPARTPPSGEMKHDAVAWQNGAPTAMTAIAAPGECGMCHQGPKTNGTSTWAVGTGGTAVKFHASLGTASQAQPGSCVDCHANTRPSTVFTSANSGLRVGLQFDHTQLAALADCASCHGSTTAWSGGKFHFAGSATPASCVPCHSGERPTSTAGWTSTTYTNSPFDYVANATGAVHGNGKDCVTCHNGPGSGQWGGTQNFVGGHYDHAADAPNSCITCHMTQRPDLLPGATAAQMAQLLGFDHSINGTGDCYGCHQATVTAGSYANLYNAQTHALPNGDWHGAISYPGSTLVGSQYGTINEIDLLRTGALVTGMSTTTTTLYKGMLHIATALPAQLNAGPAGNPDNTKCWHCHTNTNGNVTSFAGGELHASFTNYAATPGGTVTPLPQPTRCIECHAQMRPPGIVEKAGSDLQAMDHNAAFAAPANIGGSSVTNVGQVECAVCHHSPGNTWSDGAFHANIGAAVPADCTVCHYPLMADGTKSDLTSGSSYAMRHRSAQMSIQNCQTCHTGALARGATTPAAATLFQGGALHANVSAQPAACIDCHTVSEPAANASTKSSFSYTLAAGGTSTNGAQWMNHGASDVVGKDCAVCHSGDAAAAASGWSKSDQFHAAVARPANCSPCHGTGNGGGTTAGTNNNLPVGLTNATLVTSAASDPATHVAAGTHDQIIHTDVNTSGHDCNFCHTQLGVSTAAGVQGKEWAQASFHSSFTNANPMVTNGTTGRCSNCHLNIKPTSFTPDHSGFTNASGSQDCASCHGWPGTGSTLSANWLGATGGAPTYITVGGFAVSRPPATTATTQAGITNLPHPTGQLVCTTCHTGGTGGKMAIGYDHASTLIATNCNSCHEAGSNLVGTVWNGSTSQSAGAGDTRPYTIVGLSNAQTGGRNNTTHFYGVDCKECHVTPTGTATVKTGTNYINAWSFPHNTRVMTQCSTCILCHGTCNPG